MAHDLLPELSKEISFLGCTLKIYSHTAAHELSINHEFVLSGFLQNNHEITS